MQFSEWVLLALSCFIGASSPGPSIALMIRAALRMAVWRACFCGDPRLWHHALCGLVSTGIIAVMLVVPGLIWRCKFWGFIFILCQPQHDQWQVKSLQSIVAFDGTIKSVTRHPKSL